MKNHPGSKGGKSPPDSERSLDERTVVLGADYPIAASELFLELHRLLTIKIPSGEDAARLERNRSVMVLKSFADFVNRAWREPGHILIAKYLFNLALSIEQINDGTVHPIFRPPPPRSGQKDDRVDIWRARMNVCLALYCKEQDGRNKKRSELAASIAAKHPTFKKLIRHGPGRHHLSDSIISWYRAFQQGKANKIAQAGWNDWCANLTANCKGNPTSYEKAAVLFLAVATNQADTALPQNPGDRTRF